MAKYTQAEQEEALKKVIDIINEYHLVITTEHTIKLLTVPMEEDNNE